MLINSPSDLRVIYGNPLTKDERVLILTDIKATGNFMRKLRELAISLTGSPDNIVGHFSIFDLNRNLHEEPRDYDLLTLYDELLIPLSDAITCRCNNVGSTLNVSGLIMNIEPSTGVPTAYQKEHSNLSVLLKKRELLEKPRKTLDVAAEHKDFYSRIDDDKLTEFELAEYWRVLGEIFQLGHVSRGNTHFRHYDIPERLLFNKMTLLELEAYIKQFIWSFQKEIHYIIYPRDLTAALLAHIVASRFQETRGCCGQKIY